MRAARRTAVCLALALCACTEEGDDGGERDASAAGNVATALDSSSELSRLVVPLEATQALDGLPLPVARLTKIQDAIDAFTALNSSCVMVTSDLATYVEARFPSCRVAPFIFGITFDGSLRADIAVDPAGPALVVSVKIPSLEITGPLRSRRLSGELQLRHPIPPGSAPVEISGELRFTPRGGVERVLSLDVARTVDTNGCVTLSGGAELSGEDLGEPRPIALSGEQVRACRNACPTSGFVQLAYGRGDLLAWEYTGASSVTAIGPRGKRVEVQLACGGG